MQLYESLLTDQSRRDGRLSRPAGWLTHSDPLPTKRHMSSGVDHRNFAKLEIVLFVYLWNTSK